MNKLDIAALVRRLNEYRDAYYNRNESLISDKQYDDLYDKLVRAEEETGIILSNSPTITVGYEVKSELQKVRHSHPMLSLAKTKDTNELVKFAGKQDCILSCKMDGLTVLLTYDNGELIKAETRGNGEEGEDITHNAKVFENIPLTIPNKHHIEIEGEAIITYEDFERINATLPEDKKYKNPRNLASGSVRQLDSSVAKERHIKFIAWKLPFGMMKFFDGLKFVKSLGFDIVPFFTYTNKSSDKENINEIITTLKKKAEDMSYPIDGLVMTYNNIEYGKSLGMTGHHPKHSIAYKFDDEEYETTLKDIEWGMGKTGILTPIAIFEPVEIDGTIVEKASLSNLSVTYDTLGIPYIGQTIYVTKRNMIIPKIERADNKYYYEDDGSTELSKDVMITPPTCCPICGGTTRVKKDNDSEVLTCTNPNCKGKFLGKLSHFVSKNAMDIDGLSEQTLQFLVDKGWVKDYRDLYNFCEPSIYEWKHVDGFGNKSVDKILDAIEKSRTTTLDRLLNAMSIPNIGKQTAKDIAKYCDYDLDIFKSNMKKCKVFRKVDGVGDKIIDSLKSWYNTEWVDFIKLCNNLNIIKPDANNNSSVDLTGKVFVVTGSVSKFKNRDELKNKIEELGGKVTGSVSAKTNYLINNDSTSNSSKNKKAKELGVKIITEEEFINMISEE